MSELPMSGPDAPNDTREDEMKSAPKEAPDTSEPSRFVLPDAKRLWSEAATGKQLEPEAPLFQSWYRPELLPAGRIPHLGHLSLVGLLAFVALLAVSLLTRSALYFHVFGVSTVKQATEDIRYTLVGQGLLYLLTLLGCLVLFPLIWHKGFFAGLQWNGATALRLLRRLFGTAFLCFLLALVNGALFPGPTDTPIDKIFRTPGAAWLLFGFGVSFAPFFEEILFRGFLLPALCTATDWIIENTKGRSVVEFGEDSSPRWSITAMAVGSVLTSVPFALMHAEQTGYALGPFLLLISVSLVLCGTRLFTRSLAASVVVHASYNLMLFSIMMLGTGGFQHLDKM